MIELYIDGQRADLEENVDIKMTYQSTDFDSPSANKNNFSKTVKLKGTSTNNHIFSGVYKLDFNNTDSNFNPLIRTPFELYYNGNKYEEGYIKLNDIERKGESDITYNITLYGMLGDFLYSLMYKEDGTQLTLEDVYFGFQTPDYRTLTPEEENTEILFDWTKDFIKKGWDKLMNNDYNAYTCHTFIKAAPTYSGYYDDFDNDKFLINYNSLTEEEKKRFEIPEGRQTRDGYLMATGQREMDEWECKDLRSRYQRPAIKTSYLMDRILKMNDKYNVFFDDELKSMFSYYNESYVLLDRLDFDNDEERLNLKSLKFQSPYFVFKNILSSYLTYQNSPVLDTSNMTKPNYNLCFNINMLFRKDDYEVATSYISKSDIVVGGFVYTISVKDGDTFKRSIPTLVTTKLNRTIGGSKKIEKREISDSELDQFKKFFGYKELNVKYDDIQFDSETSSYSFLNDIVNSDKLPKQSNCSIIINVEKSVVNLTKENETDFGVKSYADPGWKYTFIPFSYNGCYLSSEDEFQGFYDGSIIPTVQTVSVTKKVLFGNSKSPYDYLISFCKLCGLKFIVDVDKRSIRIARRGKYYMKNDAPIQCAPYEEPIEYYVDEIIDINDKVDRQSIKINPTTVTYKSYSLSYDYGDSYASMLWNKKNGTPYGTYTYTTNYNFNGDDKNVVDDIIYKGVIPYRLNSIYFNSVSDYPPVTLSPTYEYDTYNTLGESETTKVNGYYAYNNLYKVYDPIPKMCCFDEDNGALDLGQSLVFFDSWIKYPCQLSDNLTEMITINDNPCHLISNDENEVIKVEYIPHFWNYRTEIVKHPKLDEYKTYATYSFDFYNERKLFIPSMQIDTSKMISRMYEKHLNDVYGVNSKTITCELIMPISKPMDMMRRFYYFDNSYWVINKIVDYSPNSLKHKVELIKVESIKNYIIQLNGI